MLMTLATALLAFALTSGESAQARAITVDSAAAQSCITPARTGTYRILAISKKGNEPRAAMLVLENIQGCLEVTFVTDGVGPAILRNGLRAVGPGPPVGDVGSGKMPASRRKMTPVARSDRAARRG